MTGPKELIDKLHKNQELSLEEWTELIKNRTPELSEYLFELAREERHKYYGHNVYVRGLIEFTNYCRNDCLYCGIRKSNAAAHRYRLDEDTILRCCQEGYNLGFPHICPARWRRWIFYRRADYPHCQTNPRTFSTMCDHSFHWRVEKRQLSGIL